MCEICGLGEHPVAWNRNILHLVAAHFFPFAGPIATDIDNNVDAHLRQRFVTSLVWLRPAKKPRCHFTEIANAIDFSLLAILANAVKVKKRCGAAGLVRLLFATTHRDRQQQREGEHSESAEADVHRESSYRTENKRLHLNLKLHGAKVG